MNTNTIRKAVLVCIGLIAALWWAVMPPRITPETGAALETQKQGQCPEGSHLDGKLCVCPKGSNWNGSACAAVGS
jgi:hypothetical protein